MTTSDDMFDKSNIKNEIKSLSKTYAKLVDEDTLERYKDKYICFNAESFASCWGKREKAESLSRMERKAKGKVKEPLNFFYEEFIKSIEQNLNLNINDFFMGRGLER